MLIPKKVLINLKSRYRTMPNQQLENLLNKYEKDLQTMRETSQTNYEYLGFSFEQKIQLIKQELKQRETSIELN